MDIGDVDLMELLPVGILVDSNIRTLDKFGYSFSLKGIDFETCVTMACVKEVVRFGSIELVIAEKNFFGGSIDDIVKLSKSSERNFKVVLWTDGKDTTDEELLATPGIIAVIHKALPFDKMFKKISQLIPPKKVIMPKKTVPVKV